MIKKWSSWTTDRNYNDICPNCKKNCPVQIRNTIKRIPLILFLTVPRFIEQNYDLEIDIQESLNIEQIIQGPNHQNIRHNHNLYGFICHIGNTKEGHYVSHVNVGEHDWNSDDVLVSTSKKWVLFNDANVKDDYGYLKHQMNAYIYAYYGKYIQNENLL